MSEQVYGCCDRCGDVTATTDGVCDWCARNWLTTPEPDPEESAS